MRNVYLGFGSNMGERKKYLDSAIAKISNIINIKAQSRIYESPAMLPADAEDKWNMPFLNMAVMGETEFEPKALLAHLKEIEEYLGRTKTNHWGPREIDIDILLMNDVVMHDNELNIPHKGILERPFVLLPLIDIAPDILYPVQGIYYRKTFQEIAQLKGIEINASCMLYKADA